MKPKKSPKREKVRRARDSESETDRDSSAPSETEQEETPPKEKKNHSRKVKSILKAPVRRTRFKTSDNGESKTLTSSLSFSPNGALAESELCTNSSSEESESFEDITKKILNAYKK